MRNKKTMELKFERTLQTSPREAFKAWMNPKIPGNPWYEADKLILNPKVNGFFYWFISGTPHYGRFTKIAAGSRIEHTWMSPYTLGEESRVTVTFKKKGKDTMMTLLHSDLPDNKMGRSHERGWNHFLSGFQKKFENKSGKK